VLSGDSFAAAPVRPCTRCRLCLATAPGQGLGASLHLNASLEILAPDLLAGLERAYAFSDPVARALIRALSRADYEPLKPVSYAHAVLGLCGCQYQGQGSPPLASVMAAFDFGASPSAGIMCADPVYLRADVSRVILFDAATVDLAEDEAEALLTLLNDAFADDGLRFCRGRSPSRWYLEGAPALAGATFSPLDLRGLPLEPSLAAMREMGALKRIMTEVQMILHDCVVNEVRAAAGKPPINSIWFWGVGPPPAQHGNAVQHIISDDDIACACAAFNAIDYSCDFSALPEVLAGGPESVALVCAPGGAAAASDKLAEAVLAPALAALQAARVSRLAVTTAGGRYVLTRTALWRFWRRERVFMSACRAHLTGSNEA
jgi:hypothetical protein